jgi:DNA-binding transcriptional LysR family regulator
MMTVLCHPYGGSAPHLALEMVQGQFTMKSRRQLRSVDLNLIPILRELLRTRNVTHTAEILGAPQSTISEALKRLRLQFEDEILVRVGHQMRPTAFAQSLVPLIDRFLTKIDNLSDPVEFDPAAIDRQFSIVTTDATTFKIGPELLSRLVHDAPGVTVQFLDRQHVNMKTIEEGAVDLAILPGLQALGTGICSTVLYEEELVLVYRRGLPAVGRDGVLDYDSVVSIAFAAGVDDSENDVPDLVPGRNVLKLPQYLLGALLCQRSDVVTLVPKSMADWLAMQSNIDSSARPGSIPVNMFWSRRFEHDHAHRWLRQNIDQIATHMV